MALITSSPSPSISTSILINNNTIEIDYKKGVKYLVDNSKDMKIMPLEFVLPIPEGERPSMAIDGSIPIIDLSGLNGPDEQRLSTIHAISSACAQWGFFREYLKEVWQLAIKISGAISEGLGLDPDSIESSHGVEETQIIAANYYPACPERNKTLGLAPHSDHGGLTILMDNGIPGLQIKCNQTWYSVPSIPGTFIVNLRDYLEVLSNGSRASSSSQCGSSEDLYSGGSRPRNGRNSSA